MRERDPRHAAVTVLAVVCLAVPLALPAAPALDQEQPIIDDTIGGLAIGGASDEQLAQVFTVGSSGQLVEVGLPIACSGTEPLILQIQGVAVNGEPDGTVLRAESYPAAGLPSFAPDPPSFRIFALSVPLPVVAGQQLAIVLDSPGECGIFQGPLGDPYPGGDAWFDADPNPGGWLPLTDGLDPADHRYDLPFQTFLEDRLEVAIDFEPWSPWNLIIPWRPGPVPVAVLSDGGFDATTVDETVTVLGPAGAPALGPGWTLDVDGDGDVDRVLWFTVRDTGILCGDTTVTLIGATTGGVEIRGVDMIRTIGCRRP